MSSERQIKANTKNAQSSTGPVSPEGKAIVSRNAIKHGIFAKDLVISTGDGREDKLKYYQLLAELERDLVPYGSMETLLVEKIAVNYWRLRRLIRYETGEIRNRLDNLKQTELDSYYSITSYREQPEMEYCNYGDDISESEYQEQRQRVVTLKCSSYNLLEDKEALDYVLYDRLDMEESELSDEDYEKAKLYIEGLSPQLKGKLRKELETEAEQVLAEMKEVLQWEKKFDRLLKSKSLPYVGGLNKIIKYENSLERSIFRNLAALRTLQQNRPQRRNGDDELPGLLVSDGN
jgi:hypothetical protein